MFKNSEMLISKFTNRNFDTDDAERSGRSFVPNYIDLLAEATSKFTKFTTTPISKNVQISQQIVQKS